jgi:putative ABC transport system ATP-binding protein
MSSYALEAEDLTKVYETDGSKVNALAGVNLQVERGKFVSIMGPSGSGKTTLLAMFGCLDKPTTGKVIVGGVDVTNMSESQLPKIRAEKVGFVFQSFNLLPTLTALENVELPMERGKIPKEERRERALELLRMVGLEDRKDHKPSELSAGQQQRVAIARALANNPAIILADEPTGNVDSKTGFGIIKLLRRLSMEKESTIIMVTHDRQNASLADRMLFLKDGKLLKKERKGTLHVDRAKKMKCPQCGKIISRDFSLCPYCGRELGSKKT